MKRGYGIALEDLGKNPANSMLEHIKDEQLRYRIYQASFKGIQKAIESVARKKGVPIKHVDPRKTSKICPMHGVELKFTSWRYAVCPEGGEKWHRDMVACWNILLRAVGGDGGNASSLLRLFDRDGWPVPLASTVTHDPMRIPKSSWARWNFLLPQFDVKLIDLRQ